LHPLPRHTPRERPGPVGGKRDRNRRERTQTLCQAAVPLFLEFGIQSVTIDQIVVRAKCAKGNFYRYFKNKSELVEAIFAPISLSFEEAFKASLENMKAVKEVEDLFEIYQQLGMALITMIMEQSQTILLYLQESRAPASGANKPVGVLAEMIKSNSVELTNIAQGHGLLRSMNSTLTTLTVIGATEALLYEQLKGSDLGDPVGALQDLLSMILHGLVKKG
jgi:AcrR family transcriptional regulator